MMKLLLFLFPYILYAAVTVDTSHDRYSFIKWISENSIAFDTIIVFFVVIVLLFIYSQYINRKLLLKNSEHELLLAQLKQQKYALDQHSIVSITDVKGNITYVNGKFTKISGFTEEELLGKNHRVLNSGQYNSIFWKQMYQTISSGSVWKNSAICNIKKDGSTYWVDTVIVPFMEDGKPQSYLAIRTDITESKEIEAELEQLYEEAQMAIDEKSALYKKVEKLAYNDSLTNIPNRLSLMYSFKQAIEISKKEKTKISVMFIDLDGFKRVNDELNHQTGDRVLIEVADILKKNFRKSDIYGRLGGDEFLVVILDIDKRSKLEEVCQKLLQEINKIELVSPVNENFGASIGIVDGLLEEEMDMEFLLKEADTLMYEVKKSGKNSYKIEDIAK